jgi:arginine decarboxylase
LFVVEIARCDRIRAADSKNLSGFRGAAAPKPGRSGQAIIIFPSGEHHMKIYLTVGRGDGPTPLAAFDNAMYDARVGNYNLIHLSSVIPPYSTIEHAPFVGEPKDYGDRLYVVLASQTETVPGKWAWAGLSWTQEPNTLRGLFVEQHGSSEAEVRHNLEATIKSLMARRPYEYGAINMEVAGVECKGEPVCVMVVAAYKSLGWH